jgi:hypothetical protein
LKLTHEAVTASYHSGFAVVVFMRTIPELGDAGLCAVVPAGKSK